MLSPDARAVAIDLLRPAAGWRLDQAVLTTYSLDLETLLALPLAVLAQSDGALETLLENPLHLHTALQEAGERIRVFVDRGGIGIPRAHRELYALLEPSVHLVRAPNGGAFHPKVWVARFVCEDEPPVLRVAVLSRNLTDDRSWDLALVSEAAEVGRRRVAASRPLAELFARLPDLCQSPLPTKVSDTIGELAQALHRVAFPAPREFSSPIRFHCLGLGKPSATPWQPFPAGKRLFAMAPFANRTALDAVADAASEHRVLLSRAETLDALPASALEDWHEVLVLEDTATDETEDASAPRPSGLHAKAVCVEHGWDATWFVGSANLTRAAFLGHNVEVVAELTGRRGSASSDRGCGIERLRTGMEGLWRPYRRQEERPLDEEAEHLREQLERARAALLDARLTLVCEGAGDDWRLSLHGTLALPDAAADAVELSCWPVSLPEEQGRTLPLPVHWTLPLARITCFMAFRLHAPGLADGDLRLTLKLPAEGLPEGRVQRILGSLIDSPERLLAFLRALLGGLEGLAEWPQGDDKTGTHGSWGNEGSQRAVLEDLVRAASREPARLEPVRRLMEDLRESEEGRRIVPADLLALWDAVAAAIAERGQR